MEPFFSQFLLSVLILFIGSFTVFDLKLRKIPCYFRIGKNSLRFRKDIPFPITPGNMGQKEFPDFRFFCKLRSH